FSLGADTGWDTGFTEIVPRGFTKYYGGLARIDYKVLENLGIYANTSYRQNRYPTDEQDVIAGYNPADDKTYTGRCGLNYRFYQWFSVDLSYTYRQRFSDSPEDEFTDNRFMLRFNAARPFRW
ncbi:MAG TPA: outer membrane beta-barrel protein, partial [Deltaproteobacteria bacterium]|nr:outer membrane beta-barrel protein [Deltaproteobacteria bacterium]